MSSKYLFRLDKKSQLSIYKKFESIESIRYNSHRYLEKLVNDEKFRLRIGKFRAIVKIIESEIQILVLKIDKGSRVYKRN